tara:strand:+ start:9924 stop:10418 length:495 start_codon:yes stop_codon:yes gene_type:complete
MYSCIICQSECSGKRRKYCSDECLKEGKNIHSKVYGKKWREKNKEKVKESNKKHHKLEDGEHQVYKITCPDGQFYIGSSNTKPSHRLSCHCNVERKCKTTLTHHIKKKGYNKDQLKIQILCHRSNKEQALIVENMFIKHLRIQYPGKVLNKNLNKIGEDKCKNK